MTEAQVWVVIWMGFGVCLIPSLGLYNYLRDCGAAKLLTPKPEKDQT